MGSDDQRSEFSVLEPVGKVLMTNRPTLRWSRMEGATAYVVEVYDDKFNLVTTSPQLTQNLGRRRNRSHAARSIHGR